MKQKTREEKAKRIECHPELIKILDSLEAPVSTFTWGTVVLSYYQKTQILAQKIKAKKI